jgi:aryl-alcohol dehydrogenase-like predicted oxidoreductase
MEYRNLGHSKLQVSALSLGSWNTFEFMPEQDALAVMSQAIKAGINFLDDARYDDTSGKAPMKTGYSEVVFGNLLRAGGFNRDELIISNRLWFEFFPEQSFEAEIDASLERIGIDRFDVVYAFTPPKSLTTGQLVETLAALVATGKVDYWGPANWPPELIADCCRIAERTGAPLPTSAMVPFSVSMRSSVENELMGSLCRDYGIGLLASFSLDGGVLTGKYSDADASASERYSPEHLAKMRASGLLEKSARFAALARERGHSPAQLAYAYCLRHPLVASVLFGTSSAQQLVENLEALALAGQLDDALVAEMEAIFPSELTPWDGVEGH